MTRILYLCGDLSLTGGIEKYNQDFMGTLVESGLIVKCVERKKGALLSKIIFICSALWEIIVFKPQKIICAHLYFSPIALYAKRLLNVEYSIILYGIEAVCISGYLHKNALLLASKLIVISNYTKKLVQDSHDFHEEKYFILPSSVEDDKFFVIEDTEALRKKFSLKKNDMVLLTLSRLSSTEEKGQHRVLLALKEVIKIHANIKYIIAGPGEDCRVDNTLEDNPSLKNHVLKLGKIHESDKNILYNLCDLFILPSKVEGFGIVFIEALASGAKVIASDGFGCHEALLYGELGSVVNPDSSVDIANSIINSLEGVKKRTYQNKIETREKSLKIYGRSNWRKRVDDFILGID
jgi:glycosyltransferase involved in cell wall biosynthesis